VATLSVVPTIPVAGMALILGIDRFMSEARALVNMIGNAVGTVVMAAWEGELDRDRLRLALDGQLPPAEWQDRSLGFRPQQSRLRFAHLRQTSRSFP
jgi:aerobic C4-dicarboxylate transport protein